MEPSVGANPAARAVGWNGGIPAITDPDGEIIWDSTSVICHLDTRYPDRPVLPDDPTLRFLAFALDDFADEWFYRHAVGTRWLYDENVVTGSWDIAREGSMEIEAPIDQVRQFVTQSMTGCLPNLGVTPENIEGWVHSSLVPWLRVLGDHVAEHRWVIGQVSLADFAFFGPNVAHFLNDPWCRRLVEDVAPEVVAYTHALVRPVDDPGAWFDADALPDSLVALLAEAGRHYLPWVAEATVNGSAPVTFEDGSVARIPTTNFLTEARGIILARYREARSDRLDAILERSGIVQHYADHIDQATAVPDPRPLARPADNRPYPAGR
jgi:glutathione S-transferase